MKPRMLLLGLLALTLTTAAAWAGACAICLKQIPEGQKYCEFHKGALIADQEIGAKEKELGVTLEKARVEYQAALENLLKFYQGTGNFEYLKKAKIERDDFERVRKFSYLNWENAIIPEPSCSKDIPEARQLYDRARGLQKQALPPWGANQRVKEALLLYRELIEKYPDSKLCSDAAFHTGEILEGSDFGEYRRAARFFELAYRWNPATDLPATFRAGEVYRDKLGDFEKAAQMYYLAYMVGTDQILRVRAKNAFMELQAKGYGKELSLEINPAKPTETKPTEAKPIETAAPAATK